MRLIIQGKPQSVVHEVISNPRYSSSLIKEVGNVIYKEIKLVCNNSTLLKGDNLFCFNWDDVIIEFEKYCPTLLALLTQCTMSTLNKMKKQKGVIRMVTSVLCKQRRSQHVAEVAKATPINLVSKILNLFV